MADDEPLSSELADAVLDGRPLDWAAAAAAASESQRPLIAHLQAIAGIAEFGLNTPLTWGPLTILGRIGRGSFGDVYRARDPKLDRPVALKLLRHRDHTGDEDESAAITEGRLMARVHHPSVVTVYGAERIDGRVGIWMQLVDGRTLEEELAQRGPLSEAEVARIGRDLCGALEAIHKAGLLHRDLKAQNVLRDGEGHVLVTDFGAGRTFQELPEGDQEVVTGTPLYLAPEVLNGSPASARSDIYSLGVLLFHLATGSYPIKGRSVAEIREAHREGRRIGIRTSRPDLTSRFAAVIERALETDPLRRFGSADALAEGLSPRSSGMSRPVMAAAAMLTLAIAAAALVVPGPWKVSSLGGAVVARQLPMSDWLSSGGPSADGRLFTFVDATGNVGVIDLTSGATRRITDDASLTGDGGMARSPVLSADGRFAAAVWSNGGGHELRVIDIESRQSRRVPLGSKVAVPILLDWTRQGGAILSILARSDGSSKLALVAVADGSIEPITELGGVWPQHASLSPDGRFAVYDYPSQPASSDRDIFIVGRDGSGARPLIAFPSADIAPVWTPDGRKVVFVSDRSGVMDLWGVEVEEGVVKAEPEAIHRNMGRMLLLGVTDAGGYFYQQTVGAMDVYDSPLEGDKSAGPTVLSTSYSGSNISSVWSPDGRRVALASRRGPVGFAAGFTVLVIRDLVTREQRELTPAMNSFVLRSWSPDGQAVLVQGADASGRSGAFAIDVDTGAVSSVVVNGPGQNDIRRPDWRPDGSVVYMNSRSQKLLSRDVATGAEQVLVDLKSEGLKIFANIMGRGFKLSPDGRTLAYGVMAGEGRKASVWIKPLQGGAGRELARVDAPEILMFQDWMPDREGVLFTRWNPQAEPMMVSLYRVSIDGGEPESLGLSREALRDVSVHPDGSRITFTAGNPRAEIWALEHLLPPRR